jgi:hypothetical protein
MLMREMVARIEEIGMCERRLRMRDGEKERPHIKRV